MKFSKFFEDRTEEQRTYLQLLKQLKNEGKRPIDVDKVLKYILDMSKNGISYSRGELNIREIKNQLLQGGYYYIEKEVPLDKLFITKDTEQLIRDRETENPREEDSGEKYPIVVSIVDEREFFVVDGRHRVINARDNNETSINAYVPLKLYDKYFTEITEEFETGTPATFDYSRNTEPSPKTIQGDPYQQKIEPHGIYVTQGKSDLSNHESGTMTFNNPLVLPLNSVEGNIYDENSWKMNLYKQYKKKGKGLSMHLVKLGYDGIITYDKYGPSEIVSLKPFLK